MKYGDSLAKRSPPEWAAYNVDYNEIKGLIKLHTSRPGSAAIDIPGTVGLDGAGEGFESELYDELANQHQRIDLFVRSKTGEIKRRLDYLEKITLQLQNHPQVAGRSKISVRRLEKFSRLESEILRSGDQIQALARYIGAQRLAFTKLLKKYRKWTGSTHLDARFDKGIARRSRAFERQDLDPLLLQYTELLTAVRAPFEAGVTWNADEPISSTTRTRFSGASQKRECKTANELQRIFESGTNLEVDAALAALPFGNDAGHVSYWIHHDNLLQVHVLLLQYARLKVGNSVPSTPREPSSHLDSPRESVDSSFHARFSSHETNGIIVCDDRDTFAKGRSGITIDQLEAGAGHRVEAAAASIRYAASGECLVLIYPDDEGSKGCGLPVSMPSKFKPKNLQPLFQPGQDLGYKAPESRKGYRFLGEDPQRVQSWLQQNSSIQPLVHLRYKRSRFVGLANTPEQGVWATLDGEIQMKEASLDEFDLKSEVPGSHEFPHAVLEVRWEGQTVPELVQVLNTSHLAERMPGFSLEVHAVSVLCSPPDMPHPHWMSALKRDIRKVPATPKASRRRPSIPSDSAGEQRPATGTTSTVENTSISSFSKPPTDSSVTTAPENMDIPPVKKDGRKRRKRQSRPPLSDTQFEPNHHYWNEFDDGEEAPGLESYTVLVDPNTPTPFIDGWNTLKSHGTETFSRLRAALGLKHTRAGERAPLLPTNASDYFSIPAAGEREENSSAESDTSPLERQHPPMLPSRYSMFPPYHSISSPLDPLSNHAIAQRDLMLSRYTFVTFLVAVLFATAGAVTEFSWHSRASVYTDLGVVFSIVASLSCAVAALALNSARHSENGWMGKAQLGTAFAVLCVGNGVLILHLAAG